MKRFPLYQLSYRCNLGCPTGIEPVLPGSQPSVQNHYTTDTIGEDFHLIACFRGEYLSLARPEGIEPPASWFVAKCSSAELWAYGCLGEMSVFNPAEKSLTSRT